MTHALCTVECVCFQNPSLKFLSPLHLIPPYISEPHLKKRCTVHNIWSCSSVKEHALPHSRQPLLPISAPLWKLFPPIGVRCCFIVVASLSFCSSADSGVLCSQIVMQWSIIYFRPRCSRIIQETRKKSKITALSEPVQWLGSLWGMYAAQQYPPTRPPITTIPCEHETALHVNVASYLRQ